MPTRSPGPAAAVVVVLAAAALLVGAFSSRPADAAPAAKPDDAAAARHAPFKVVQEVRVDGGEPATVEFHFANGRAAMVDASGKAATYLNLVASAAYNDRHDRMLSSQALEDWAKGWRQGAEVKTMLADPKREPFTRAALWPEPEVTPPGDEKLTVATPAMRFDIDPMKDAPPDVADAFARMYRLDTFRSAYEAQNALGSFVVAEVARVLAERHVLPARMTITTFAPGKDVVAVITLKRADLSAAEREALAAAAKKFDAKPVVKPKPKPQAKPAGK